MSNFLGGRYKLVKLIGKGGMADVYLALDTILNREVAIKILKPEMCSDKIALERFAREAKASACLNHPNIVEIYDIGDDGNKHFIVMEYIKGYTLKKLIDVRGAIPVKESVWLMKQLALALLEAHKNGIIHRDVKSQNVLIKDDGTVKMADFGIAQAVNDIQITHQDTILGSVHYLAPELTKGKPASMQSDIYSLGIVFFELLSGKVPFNGDSAVAIALQHVNNKMPSIRSINPQVPQSVENIITKATAKNLSNRYQNVAQMVKDLNECLQEEHLNDKPLIFDTQSEISSSTEILEDLKKNKSFKNTDTHKLKKNKLSSGLYTVGLLALVIVVIFALAAVLFFSGIIGPERASKTSFVPDIQYLTVTEANDILEKLSLSIDTSNIERVMTEDVEEGLIISYEPSEGSEITKGSNIKVVVSSGKWALMDNFIGMGVDDVKEKMIGTYFNVTYKAVESKEKPFTVVGQSIAPNEKYNPNVSNNLVIEYAQELTIVIAMEDRNIKGAPIDDVKNYFESKGFKVVLTPKGEDYFIEEELQNYPPRTVIRIIPDLNSTFIQTDDNYIEIIYYEGEIS